MQKYLSVQHKCFNANILNLNLIHHSRTVCIPNFYGLVIIEYQRPNLNTLSRRLILVFGIRESRVRDPPRTSIIPRVKALDQRHLIRALRVLIVPAMIGVRLHHVRLAGAIRVNEVSAEEILVGN